MQMCLKVTTLLRHLHNTLHKIGCKKAFTHSTSKSNASCMTRTSFKFKDKVLTKMTQLLTIGHLNDTKNKSYLNIHCIGSNILILTVSNYN